MPLSLEPIWSSPLAMEVTFPRRATTSDELTLQAEYDATQVTCLFSTRIARA
jgi:hypothetical protein